MYVYIYISRDSTSRAESHSELVYKAAKNQRRHYRIRAVQLAAAGEGTEDKEKLEI